MMLSSIGISTNDVLHGIDNSLVRGIRNSFDRSLVLRNSIKLSLPTHITSTTLALDLSSFYAENTATSIIAGKFPIGYSFWFGAVIPRVVIGIPIGSSTEFWGTMNYYEGPADMWLGIQKSDARLKILNGAFELKHYVILNDFLNIGLTLGASATHEINNISTAMSSIRFIGSSWLGNETISYDSYAIMFPTYISAGLQLGNFSTSLDTGVIFGNLSKLDSFSRQGVMGPVFGGSDMYLLNIISKTKYRIIIFEPLAGMQIAYQITDSLKIVAGYMPSWDFSINTGSLRITWSN